MKLSAGRSSLGPAFAVWICSAVWLGVAPALVSLLGVLQWKSLPFPESGRIVQINAGLTVAQALAGSEPFAAISAFESGWLVTEGPSGTAAALSSAVDAGFFDVFATQPSSGRVFSSGSESDDAGAAIVTESLSRRLFGRGREPLGEVFRASGRELEVLGVIPDQPSYPPSAQLWVLRSSGIRPNPSFVPPQVIKAGVVGRIAASSSLQAADALMRRTVFEMEQRDHVLHGDVEVVPLDRILRRRTKGERGILLVSLSGILAFVALAFSSALSGYLVEKRTDFAVRLALGARRRDLARHVFGRILLISVPGAAIGLPLGVSILDRIAQLAPPSLGALIPARLDAGSLLMCTTGWLIVVVVCTAVAWLSSRQLGPRSLFSLDGPGMLSLQRVGRVRLVLVCSSLAVAMTLGAVTETLRRSLANLESEPLGFEPRGVISAVVRFDQADNAPLPPSRLAGLSRRVENLPGVAAVALSDTPLFGGASRYLETSTLDRSRFWMARVQRFHGRYLQVAGLRLGAGRGLTDLEIETGSPVALLDQTGAQKMFPEGQALGSTLVVGGHPVEIVGIVATTKDSALDEPPRPQLYLPLRTGNGAGQAALAMSLRVTQPVSEGELAEAVSSEEAALSQVRPVQEDVAASLASRRLARNMVLVVSGAILALVTLTTFATYSWLLELRSGELAVRQALGEAPRGIALRVLRGALWLISLATILGLALYFPAGKAIRGLLFGVDALNPSGLLASFLGIGALALAATAMAAGLTLRRQMRNLARRLGQP